MATGGSASSHGEEGIRSMKEGNIYSVLAFNISVVLSGSHCHSEHHLKYLLEDTVDAQTKWYYIGLCLGLPPPKLGAMREDMDTSQER